MQRTTRASRNREAEPEWLNAEERDAWLGLVGMMIKLPSALDAQLQRDSGLSHFEYVVLSVLSERDDYTMRMSDLAALTNSSLSRLSHVAKRLGHQGFLRRQTCPEDGRYTNAILTEAGYTKVVKTAPGHVATARSLVIDALTPADLRSLRRISRRILDKVDPEANWDRAKNQSTC